MEVEKYKSIIWDETVSVLLGQTVDAAERFRKSRRIQTVDVWFFLSSLL
jgi:hypothetical protein